MSKQQRISRKKFREMCRTFIGDFILNLPEDCYDWREYLKEFDIHLNKGYTLQINNTNNPYTIKFNNKMQLYYSLKWENKDKDSPLRFNTISMFDDVYEKMKEEDLFEDIDLHFEEAILNNV